MKKRQRESNHQHHIITQKKGKQKGKKEKRKTTRSCDQADFLSLSRSFCLLFFYANAFDPDNTKPHDESRSDEWRTEEKEEKEKETKRERRWEVDERGAAR